MAAERVLTLPNAVTLSRLVLTPFIVFQLLLGDCRMALILSAIAGATDALDGQLARGAGQVTRLGAYLDPLADKVLLTALFITLGVEGVAPMWLVWIVVGRDAIILLMAAAALLFTNFRDFPPSQVSKANTVLQILTALYALSRCTWPDRFADPPFEALAILTALTTVWSGIEYWVRAIRMLVMRRAFIPADRQGPRG